MSVNIDNMYSQCISSGIDTIIYSINSNIDNSLLENKLLNQKSKYILINANSIENKISNKYIEIKINNENISAVLENMPNCKDSLNRICVHSFDAIRINKNGESDIFHFNAKHNDTISYNDVDSANKSNYRFATAAIPEKKESFFKRILEPTLVAATAALTTIMFFTIRSK